MLLDLAGDWQLSDDSGRIMAPMALPGDGISALHKAGLIPDPYFGRNEYGLRWISETDWVVSRSFTTPRTDLKLVVGMLDTVAEVSVNGQSMLHTDTMFRQHQVDLSSVLRVGVNEISIRFSSPARIAAERQASMSFYIPYASGNCPIPHGNMLRKPACDFGWDWNIALAPFGVYGEIGLELVDKPALTDIVIRQSHDAGNVTLHITARGVGVADGAVSIAIAGATAQGQIVQGKADASITLQNPALWWPAGVGAQTLHDLVLTAGDVTATRRIGLRALDLITEKDAVGTGFKFRVNGHDIFAKGANWIPADALASNITPAVCRDLLQSAVDANMNMIRVWGGGRYEPDWFYDLCDELGLMVWQDFMFACNLYPSTADFLTEVAREVAEQVARLDHHACIALWCGDNELIGALTWFPESRENRDRYLVSYDRLNRTIETALKETAPAANWWPSSPSPGPMSFGDAWHDDANGDMHFWSVWHEGRDFDHYRDVKPRFCSEFGFQSYPSMDVIARFADPVDWNIAAPVFESHQKNAGGNARIAETMFRYFRFPATFPDFVWLSQIQQGLAIKTAVTQWRSIKPHCMGALYWQLNDTWPVCSWSSLDHGGGWKLMHHMARDFFAPVTVVAVPDGPDWVMRGVNDHLTATPLQLTVQAVAMDGSTRPLWQGQASVGPDAAQDLTRIAKAAVATGEILQWQWSAPNGQGRDHIAPLPYKAYDLLEAGLSLATVQTDTGWQITLTAKALSLFATVLADQPGRFDSNAVTVIPGQAVTLHFTPQGDGEPRFTCCDLRSATYGVP